MGLTLPDIKGQSNKTKGDDTPQERAMMRLKDDVKKSSDAQSKLTSQMKSTNRKNVRKGKDPEVDFAVAYHSGKERSFETNAFHTLKDLGDALKGDNVNASRVNDLLKKVYDDPSIDDDVKRELQKVRAPKISDVTRDIHVAAAPDDENEQPTELNDYIRTLAVAQRDALTAALTAQNTRDEHDRQKRKKIRS